MFGIDEPLTSCWETTKDPGVSLSWPHDKDAFICTVRLLFTIL